AGRPPPGRGARPRSRRGRCPPRSSVAAPSGPPGVRALRPGGARDGGRLEEMSTKGTVVVVEDDPNIAELVALYLRRDGFSVEPFDRGESALARAGAGGVTLVVADVGLPGDIDGFEVCRRLRREGGVPVIMLTARDDEVDRIEGLELGADDYVTKPFS